MRPGGRAPRGGARRGRNPRGAPGAASAVCTVLAMLMAAVLLAASDRAVQVPGGASEPADVDAAIDRLGSLDYGERTNAARTIRRTPAPLAVARLLQAVAEHRDGFVRFRALVLLTAFDDPRTRDVMLGFVGDPNDRLRTVAYEYFEHHPGSQVAGHLLRALADERAEFVRPALARALVAQRTDPRVRETMLGEIGRGDAVYRGAVVQALGDYHAEYAVAPLIELAEHEGPLQGDAVLALGKIGDKRALPALVSLQRRAPGDEQPRVAAAICLLGVNCGSHLSFLERTLRFAQQTPGFQPLLRSAASGLGAVAQTGNRAAADLLIDLGGAARDPARAPLALALGGVALRNPDLILSVLEPRADLADALDLLRDGFDMLEEDLAKERFFATVRRAYWKAAETSRAREIAGQLIRALEF